MALVKAPQGEVTVWEGVNHFTIGTEALEIPDALLPAALAAGAVEAGQVSTASKTQSKAATAAKAETAAR
jgi:hypothetical protein